jgi:hypothetical protein
MHPDDVSIQDLEDPSFLAWLDNKEVTEPIEPEECDIDPNARTRTLAEIQHEYREAQVRKLVRLYLQWRREQN